MSGCRRVAAIAHRLVAVASGKFQFRDTAGPLCSANAGGKRTESGGGGRPGYACIVVAVARAGPWVPGRAIAVGGVTALRAGIDGATAWAEGLLRRKHPIDSAIRNRAFADAHAISQMVTANNPLSFQKPLCGDRVGRGDGRGDRQSRPPPHFWRAVRRRGPSLAAWSPLRNPITDGLWTICHGLEIGKCTHPRFSARGRVESGRPYIMRRIPAVPSLRGVSIAGLAGRRGGADAIFTSARTGTLEVVAR